MGRRHCSDDRTGPPLSDTSSPSARSPGKAAGYRLAGIGVLAAGAAAVVIVTALGFRTAVVCAKPPAGPPRRLRACPTVHYDRDVRAILSDRCYKCHGPDPKPRQADLRLDERESARAIAMARPIVPGDLEASELWRRINSDDPKVHMPPPGSAKKPLSAEEKARSGNGSNRARNTSRTGRSCRPLGRQSRR